MVVAVVVVLLVAAATAAGAQEEKKDPMPAYLFSILLGFGTGHFYLHDGGALRFLLLEGGALVVTGIGIGLALAAVFTMNPSSPEYSSSHAAGTSIGVFGFLAFTGFRYWEIVDLILTVKRMRSAGKVAMRPAVQLSQGRTQLGVALSY
jgi:hypothetical protein